MGWEWISGSTLLGSRFDPSMRSLGASVHSSCGSPEAFSAPACGKPEDLNTQPTTNSAASQPATVRHRNKHVVFKGTTTFGIEGDHKRGSFMGLVDRNGIRERRGREIKVWGEWTRERERQRQRQTERDRDRQTLTQTYLIE